jgi:hypothetical protein
MSHGVVEILREDEAGGGKFDEKKGGVEERRRHDFNRSKRLTNAGYLLTT